MSKLRRLVVTGALGLALAMGATTTANAEALGMDLGLFGAYLDSDDLQEGYGAGAKIKLNIVEFFAIDVRGSYLMYDDADIDMIPVEACALLQLPLGDALNLYGGVGVGYYMFEGDDVELDDAVGYFPVAGAEISIGDIKVFGEVRWLALSPDVDSASDELEGIVDGEEAEADGIGVNIGLALDL